VIHHTNNCPINERTGDGILVGRCWFSLKDGSCPRHGNVTKAVEVYKSTGQLTPEDIICHKSS
jgi:hypothetical protein